MKTKFTFSILLMSSGLFLLGKAVHTAWILASIEYHGGVTAPRWVPILCLMFAAGFVLDAIGWALLFIWWRARLADKTQRPNRALEWFHLRFRVRRPGGLPWHGLKKFDARTAANILLAGRKKSAFAELKDLNPALAEEIVAQAYAGLPANKIFKNLGYSPPESANARLRYDDVVYTAIWEAVEIYSPKP